MTRRYAFLFMGISTALQIFAQQAANSSNPFAPLRFFAGIWRGAQNGRVLEIGVGSGLNLPLYTNRATEILGLNPHPKLLGMASEKPLSVPSRLIEGSAESIPLDDASIDTVVTTWSHCTIPDVVAALAEIRRVIKPDGQLLFVGHGQASENSVRKWQNRLTPAWKRLAGAAT